MFRGWTKLIVDRVYLVCNLCMDGLIEIGQSRGCGTHSTILRLHPQL